MDVELTESVEAANAGINEMVDTIEVRIRNAENKINSVLTKMARSFLLSNLGNSGIKSKTGKLRSALAAATVSVDLQGRKPNIKIAMPSGVDDYENGSNFYEVAASLSYGAVHNTSETNKKRKSKLKKAVQRNNKKKKPSGQVVAQGHVLTGLKQNDKGTTKAGGGTYVTKAFGFWELDKSQMNELREAALEIFNQEVYG